MGWVWWIDWRDDCDRVGGTRGFQLYPAGQQYFVLSGPSLTGDVYSYPAGQQYFASSGPSLTGDVHSAASPVLLATVRKMARK